MSESKRILVAEDEKPLAEALKLKLDGSGFNTTVVNDGEEVLDLVNNQNFDLILLDLIMPKKDGFVVLEELKKMGNTTPVIVVSNLSQAGDIDRVKKLGAKEYLIKSDTPLKDIVEKIKSYL
jgi:CheY-like chemotaxis protein